MITIPVRERKRIERALPEYQRIVADYCERKLNEDATIDCIKNICEDLLGYRRNVDITMEHRENKLRDIALCIEGKIEVLIEVKEVGVELSDGEIARAATFAAQNQIDWCILTNGVRWRVFRIDKQPLYEAKWEFIFSDLSMDDLASLAPFYALSKASVAHGTIEQYEQYKQSLKPENLVELVLADSSLKLMRRELRKQFPAIKIECEEIYQHLVADVLCAEVLSQS